MHGSVLPERNNISKMFALLMLENHRVDSSLFSSLAKLLFFQIDKLSRTCYVNYIILYNFTQHAHLQPVLIEVNQ